MIFGYKIILINNFDSLDFFAQETYKPYMFQFN